MSSRACASISEEFGASAFPSLRRRGGCASNKKSRSHRSGADGVVAHKPCFGTHSWKMACERPPRRLRKRRLRDIFLMSRPPLLCKEGNVAHHASSANSFTPYLSSVRRQAVGDVFARIVASAHSHDDVLRAVHTVRHRGSALCCRHQYCADFFTCCFFVCPEHGTPRMFGRCSDLWVTNDDQRLRDQQPDTSSLTSLGNGHSSKRLIV